MGARAIGVVIGIGCACSCGGSPAEPPAVPPPAAIAPQDPEPVAAPSEEPRAEERRTEEPQTEERRAEEPPPPPPRVEVSAPEFVGDGEVPKIDGFLDKTRELAARCVAEHGGLAGDTGQMKVQFLVRLQAKAEGVEVLSSKNVSEEAKRCVRQALKGKSVPVPTADPVGVQFTYRFAAAAPE